MKAKISSGNNFKGVFSYLARKEGTELIASNMAGTTVQELAAEMEETRRLREKIKKPVWHCSLSLPPGEKLPQEKWGKIIMEYLARMGINTETHQWVAYEHHDTKHAHVHVVVNRIGLDAGVWDRGNDVYRAIRTCQELESDFGLTRTPGRENRKFGAPVVKRAELEKAVREELPPVKLVVAEAIKGIISGGELNVRGFVAKLKTKGIMARPNVASTGKMNGFSFVVAGRNDSEGKPFAVKASDCGASWKFLQGVVNYDISRDTKFLQGIKDGSNPYWAGFEKIDGGVGDHRPEHGGASGFSHGSSRGGGATPGNFSDNSGPGNPEVKPGDISSIPSSGGLAGGDLQADSQAVGTAGGVDGGVHGWVNAATTVLSLTGGKQPAVQAATGAGEMTDLDRKKMEIRRLKLAKIKNQLDALGCTEYRIQAILPQKLGRDTDLKGRPLYSKNLCRPDGAKGTPEKFFKIGEEENWVDRATDFNINFRDIYITPRHKNYYYLIVDDLNFDKIKSLQEAGFKPCLTMESSRENFHSIIRVEKTGRPFEREAANQLVKTLNLEFGGDPRIAGCEHQFRVPGYQNKKVSRNGEYVKIQQSVPGGVTCQKAGARLEEIRKTLENRAQEAAMNVEKPEATAVEFIKNNEVGGAGGGGTRAVDAAYKGFWESNLRYIQSKNWAEDRSQLDFKTAGDLLLAGYSPWEVRGATLRCSPALRERHPNAETWVETLLDAVVKKRLTKMAPQQLKKIHPATKTFLVGLGVVLGEAVEQGMSEATDSVVYATATDGR